jgi:hypothetical protein
MSFYKWLAAISAVVFFLTLLGIAYYSSPPPHNPREQQTTAEQKASNEEQKQKIRPTIWQFMFPDSLSVFTLWLVISTFGLGIVAIIQLGFLGRQEIIAADTAEAAKDSADAAKKAANVAENTLIASQRAWIRIDEIGLGGGGLAFDENGASVSISFKITNVGNSPAVNVTPHAWLIVLKQGGPFAIQEQQRLCAEIRESPFGLGFTLFPGENFPTNMGYGAWSLGVNVSKDEIKKGRAVSADGKHVELHVFGCIDYTFPTDATTHHQTGFIREIRKRGPFLLSPDNGIIRINDLILTDTGIGLGQYAD